VLTTHLTRVLIVEDEPRMRDMLARAVAGMSCSAQGARHAEEALRQMADEARGPAEVVILDLNLPGMTGTELLPLLKQRWPATQVIILTGFGDLDAARQAIRCDAVDFLTKPCHLGELEAALDRARRRLAPPPPSASAPAAGGRSYPGANPASAEASEAFERPDEAEACQERPLLGAGRLDALERHHILAVLARHAGNRAAAAAELGISVRTLYYRLAEYDRSDQGE
jgi:DNA-binding NtrC family response regulator